MKIGEFALGKSKYVAVMLAILMVFCLNGCAKGVGADGLGKDESLQKVLDKKELVIGLDENYPPMGFVDESGEIVGFDIDVAEVVCKQLGVELVKHPIDWDNKEEDLNSGEIDCIWNGMSATPERAQVMTLSEPYLKNTLIFVVGKDSKVKGMRDLKGKTIGVQSGSSVVDVLEASNIHDEVSVIEYNDNKELMDELDNGRIDAILIDSIAAYYFIFSTDNTYYVLSDSIGEEECAIGFRKGDHSLCDAIWEIISQMKADGSLGEISKKWFGTDITIVR